MATEAPEVAPAPDIPNGASERGDGTVTFALWAPLKKSVHLIGDFNEWKPEPLKVDESGLWWIEKQLDPGTYVYQFVLDGATTICDPYARRIRWDEGSPQPQAVIEVGAQPYEWHDGDFGIKPLNQLVIYEMHVGNFSPEGTFDGVIERLDYLAELGIDAIELMPVQEFPGDQGWGYNPAYMFTVESAYGSVEDFKRMVDAAHQRGIGVILDMVLAHTAPDSPLVQLYPRDQNPYFNPDDNRWGFPEFNQTSDAAKRFFRDVQDYWLTEFHVDGFRYDYIEGISYDGTNGASFLAWAAKQSKPYAYLIAEAIVQDPAAVVRDTDMDCSWHWQFMKVMRAQLFEGEYEGNSYGDLDAVERVLRFDGDGYQDNAQPVIYLETHDEERLMADAQSCNPNIDEAGAIRKSMLGAIALFTAQGVPMLYQGQEFGTSSPKTIDVSKLPWENLESDAGRALHQHYATLAYLRHMQGALHTNNFQVLLKDAEKRVIVFHRWDDNGSDVVVALNFSPVDQHVTFAFPRAGRWHEWLNDYDEQVSGEEQEFELNDSYGKIWVFQE
jgi:malto-oligosyltrehalose trehalohydrolase